MIPFLSQIDLLVAAGVVAGVMSVGGAVLALARAQRPASRPVPVPAQAEERAVAAEAAGSVAAA